MIHTTASETEALELPVREFGTVCHAACKHLTSVTNSLKHYWKHICLTRPRCLVTFIYRHFRNILTYLLTYLVTVWNSLPAKCQNFFGLTVETLKKNISENISKLICSKLLLSPPPNDRLCLWIGLPRPTYGVF